MAMNHSLGNLSLTMLRKKRKNEHIHGVILYYIYLCMFVTTINEIRKHEFEIKQVRYIGVWRKEREEKYAVMI